MTASRQNPPVECSGHCDRCGLLSVASPMHDEKVGGWRIVWRSFVVFLLPLLGAIAGARILDHTLAQQIMGAAAGFLAALATAIVIMRRFPIHSED